MRRYKWRAVFVIVLSLMMSMVMTSAALPAMALVALPYFAMTPNSAPLGTTFTGDIEYYSGIPNQPNHGCSNDVTYTVSDPNGNLAAQGILPAMVTEPSVQWFTFQVTVSAPEPPGVYTIEGMCDGFMARGQFEVTQPTTPPSVLTLSPREQTHAIDDNATVIARLTDGTTGVPITGTPVSFELSGPNSTIGGTCAPVTCATDADGQVTWTYAGLQTGEDLVSAHVGTDPASGPEGLARITWTESIHGKAYVALGDSYSSGEGTDDYILETDLSGYNTCHRSDLAYGPLADTDRDLGPMAFRACSGAITADLFSPNHSGNRLRSGDAEPAQMCQVTTPSTGPAHGVQTCPGGLVPALGPKTRNITLTIGGNDAGFESVVSSCVFWWLVREYGKPGRGCSTDPNVVDPAMRRLQALAGWRSETINGQPIYSISTVLAALHQLAPNAHIYIAGYPRLFDAGRGICKVGTVQSDVLGMVDVKIHKEDAQWLDDAADLLNSITAKAARKAGPWVTYVDVSSRFAGHGICSADPWLNPISGVDFKTVQPTGQRIDSRSLHPTPRGQSQGYEATILAANIKP